MSDTINQFRKPRSARRDLSQGPVFVAAILVFAVVGSVLFFGSTWGITPSIYSANFGAKTNARSVVPRPPTRVPTPATRSARPTPVLLADTIQSLPTMVAAATSSATPTVAPPIVTGRTASPIAPLVGHVGNTGGDGAYLRRSPRLSDRWLVWVDSTPLVLLGNQADGDGQHWLQVRDPMDNVGWIPAQYVTP